MVPSLSSPDWCGMFLQMFQTRAAVLRPPLCTADPTPRPSRSAVVSIIPGTLLLYIHKKKLLKWCGFTRLTPKRHKYCKKYCSWIVEQVRHVWVVARLAQFDVPTGLIAKRTQCYVSDACQIADFFAGYIVRAVETDKAVEEAQQAHYRRWDEHVGIEAQPMEVETDFVTEVFADQPNWLLFEAFAPPSPFWNFLRVKHPLQFRVSHLRRAIFDPALYRLA